MKELFQIISAALLTVTSIFLDCYRMSDFKDKIKSNSKTKGKELYRRRDKRHFVKENEKQYKIH